MTDSTITLRDASGASHVMRTRDDGAGELFYHALDGAVGRVTAIPLVSTTQYGTGECIGGLMTFDNITRANDKPATLQQLQLYCKSQQAFAFDLVLFSANPSASTFTDNAAFVVAAADYDKIIDVVHVVDWTNLGTASPSFAKANGLAVPFNPESGTRKIYGQLVARATPTLLSTSDIKVALKVFQD